MHFKSNPFFNKRNKCPICHSRVYIKLFDLPFHSEVLSGYLISFYRNQGKIELDYLNNVNYSLCKCQTCKGIFQEFIPNDQLMEKLYEEWISPEKALAAQQTKEPFLIPKHKKEISTIKHAFFKNRNSIKVLDYGLGWGTWARTAKNLGWEVYGTELSKSRIAYAIKHGIEIINLDNSIRKFDFINTEQVFEHLPNPLTTLTRLHRCLKEEGIIKISVPTAKNIEKRLNIMDWEASKHSKTSLNPVAPLEHINFFTRESLLKMAQLTELKEIKIPMIIQYKNIRWSGDLRQAIKKSSQPFRLNYLNDLNYIFLKKAGESQ